MVRMVRMVRSLADRTFQLWVVLVRALLAGRGRLREDRRVREEGILGFLQVRLRVRELLPLLAEHLHRSAFSIHRTHF